METKELWAKSSDCCGCGACAAKCPRGAICMEDAGGFVYPKIDSLQCINCGVCKKVCGLQNRYAQETSGPWYAARHRGDASLSASAGAFYGLALSVISEGGVAFGAAYVREGDALCVRHIMAEDVDGLRALQGSKYVQSDAGACFIDVRKQLETGRAVLFSGTPCQVAGLRGYLGRDWPNLLTVDLVCHGVPSEAMFRSLVSSIESDLGRRVIDVRFRCKREGWSHSLLLLLLLRPFGAIDASQDEELLIPARDFAYYDLFLNLKTLRDSCYSCPFAGRLRPGDITVGDFWGVDKSRPDVLEDGGFDLNRGVSCLLVNTKRGLAALKEYGGDLDLYEVSFQDIAEGNDQLRRPSVLPADRNDYITAYRNGGWNAVETLWRRRERGVRYHIKQMAKSVAPKWLIKLLRSVVAI